MQIIKYANAKLAQVKKIRQRLYQVGAHEELLGVKKAFYHDEEVVKKYFFEYKRDGISATLDIGSGPNPRNPFGAKNCCGVDIRANPTRNVHFADLSNGKLPFEDMAFDYVTAYDVLEHIPRVSVQDGITRFPFVLLLNEVFRVLKVGGVFFNVQPCFPAKEAFQDPTHVNIMTEDTIDLYFCERAWARIYGFDGNFSMLKDGWYGPKYFSFIRKISELPILDFEFVQRY